MGGVCANRLNVIQAVNFKHFCGFAGFVNKLGLKRYKNSNCFMRDEMVDFPKFGHISLQGDCSIREY